MPETRGFVQEISVYPSSSGACVDIGPAPDNVEILVVSRLSGDTVDEGAFHNSMLEALTAAMIGRHEVIATHDDGNSRITTLRIEPT